MKYKHLFFDLDHTLWDFDANSEITLSHLFQDYQLQDRGVPEISSFLKQYKHHNDIMWERFRKGFIKREDLRWKRIWLTLLDFNIYDSAMAHEMSATYLERLPMQTRLLPNAKETLQYCKDKGYQLHLITNGFEVTQRQKIQFSGIAHFFNEIITSETSMSMKPHAGIFEYAEQQTGAQKQNSLMIGDALDIDILGAKNAGWDQVYFNPNKPEISGVATFEIQNLAEMKTFL